jgi:exodeoxyribonuclease-3
MKLISWNVNGVRAILKKGFLEWFMDESPDILCLQETKATEEQAPDELKCMLGYNSFWCSGVKKGYSGVACFVKKMPQNVEYGFNMEERFDNEGRIIS